MTSSMSSIYFKIPYQIVSNNNFSKIAFPSQSPIYGRASKLNIDMNESPLPKLVELI